MESLDVLTRGGSSQIHTLRARRPPKVLGIRLAHPVPVDPGASLTQGSLVAHAAQGGVTLGPEQGAPGGGEFLSSWRILRARQGLQT